MSTTRTLLPRPAPEAPRTAEPVGPVGPGSPTRHLLVATDGGPGTSTVLAVARALAARDGAEVTVATLFEPRYPVPAPPPDPTARPYETSDDEAVAELRAGVDQLAHAVLGDAVRWTTRLDVGVAAAAVARVAAATGAELIVLASEPPGERRRHDRPLPVQVALLAQAPVLAVGCAPRLPARHAMVLATARDADPRTLRAVGVLLASPASVTLLRHGRATRRDAEGARTIRDARGAPPRVYARRLPDECDVTTYVAHLVAACEADVLAVELPGDTATVRNLTSADVAPLYELVTTSMLLVPLSSARDRGTAGTQ